MSRRNGFPQIQLPGPMQAMPPQEIVQVLAQPFNDVQLLAMVAGSISAQTGEPARKCVEQAADIVFEAFIHNESLGRRIQTWARERQMAATEAPAG